LRARRIYRDGRKVLLHLTPGSRENYMYCSDFRDMARHGLHSPLMMTIKSSAPGLIRAVTEVGGEEPAAALTGVQDAWHLGQGAPGDLERDKGFGCRTPSTPLSWKWHPSNLPRCCETTKRRIRPRCVASMTTWRLAWPNCVVCWSTTSRSGLPIYWNALLKRVSNEKWSTGPFS
jgi:hypothetical protein